MRLPLRTLLSVVMLGMSAGAHAQLLYTFKDTTTPYVPLSASASSLNAGNVWIGDNYVAPMPFSWKMDSSITQTGLPLITVLPIAGADTAIINDVNGFMFGDFAGAVDRGVLTNSSLSPIRYATLGTMPNRIFKLEFTNAGFLSELGNYSTVDDSFNMQIWVYETSNIVELHYGSSRVSNPADYFSNGVGPIIGYLKHADFDSGTTGTIYYIKGAGTPGIDSLSITAANPPSNTLSAWPASGKVFRFTPKWGACTVPTATFSAGTPSGKTVQYTYTGTTTSIDSLVWNWGDGSATQKVTSSFTTPLSHTFTNSGRYTVTVTTYSSCGNAVSTKQVALAVGDLAALGNVKVYPNPATDLLVIEGLTQGGNAIVRSALGQVVLRSELSNGRETLHIAMLPAGVYSLSITDAAGTNGVIRFIKQ